MADNLEQMSAEVSQDGFLDGRFTLIQPKKGLRAGSDALYLSASVPAKPGQSIVEAGIGTGAAALALLTRVPDTRLLGIENFAPHAELARANADLNEMTERLAIIEGDVLALKADDMSRDGFACPFDHAMANPPFFDPAENRRGRSASRNAANVMSVDGLVSWVKNLSAWVRPGGTVTFVHRIEAFPQLLAAMDHALGDIHVLPLCATAGKDARRVLVQGIKGNKAPMKLIAPFVLHEADGRHTCQSEAVLRGGKAIDLRRQGLALL